MKLFGKSLLGAVLLCFVAAAGEGEEPSCDGDDCGKATAKTGKELYADLREALGRVREACGDVCDTTGAGEPGKYYDSVRKEVNCRALFENKDIDAPSEFPTPPGKIPKWMIDDFTYQGRVNVSYGTYMDDSQGKGHHINWSEELVDRLIQAFRGLQLAGGYGVLETFNVFRHLATHMEVKDKRVLVLGSQTPWIEAVLLEAGAARITTVDYVQITSTHPQITTLTPGSLAKQYLAGSLPQFDAMVTFSSLEHSGLGRYGDALNPWGDLIAMARSWCLVKPGGRALVGVPAGPDRIFFNTERIYGKLMLSHLFSNWKQIYTETDFSQFGKICRACYQPIFILEKEGGEP